MNPLLFKNGNHWIRILLVGLSGSAVMIAAVVWYYFTPKYTRAGYQPNQPVPFSHEFHVGQLGMSCTYCHTHVDESSHSNVPATQTCMNCHLRIKADSPLLSEVRKSWESGEPIPWEQVHRLPDYAYFNHALHVNRGVSCVSCHGQVNEMEVVYHAESLSMGWCLDCHRNPTPHLRPRDEVYNLDWSPPGDETPEEIGERIRQELNINPSDNCQGCHR